ASCVPSTPTNPPDAHLPATYRGVAGSPAPSLANLPWQKLYDDPVLQQLIARALERNYNAQLAYEAVVAAGENLNITHAGELPAVSASLSAPYQVTEGSKSAATPSQAFVPGATVGASYEVDLFGKLKSATAAARAQVLASEEAYDAVLWSLVAQVASTYFQLRELDAILAITQNAIRDRQESLRLVKLRVQYGESSLQDQRQAEQSLYEVSENVPLLNQNIAQTENALSVLTGDYPHDIARGLPLEQQIDLPPLPPTGIPSELLARRPDIRQADDTLVAADAQIDVARKLLLPAFTIGASGAVSGQYATGAFPNLPKILSSLSAVNGVFLGPTGLFSLLPQLTQTIFAGGALKAHVRLTQAQQQQAVLSYLKAVQSAFADVANGVAAYDQQRAYRAQQELYLAASVDSTRLATLRYDEAQTSYLEVLEAQTREYQAQSGTLQARLNERLALVQLYLALGGGLPPETTADESATTPQPLSTGGHSK
ncbi:MAG: efflux transporter outer membrane subunit, partial [Vulcanimicrobiaceae bacterium]